MDPILHAPGTIKGTEVLYFPDAEVSKIKGNDTSFATFGPMSVLYFKDYNRFVLQINDWRYPLLRRLNTQGGGLGAYTLPAQNGFSYSLRINNAGAHDLSSLDALLEGTRKLEASPEDKLVRLEKKVETGPKEVITETIKQVIHKVQNKAASLKTGTKHLTSTKKRVNLKDIKNKNFKKDAHSKIKKEFFQTGEKLTQEFQQKRQQNHNLTGAREFDSLRKLDGATFYIPKGEIEDAIISAKDIAAPLPSDKKGLMANIREGLQTAKDTLTGLVGERGRERNAPEVHAEKTPITEGMTHYQG